MQEQKTIEIWYAHCGQEETKLCTPFSGVSLCISLFKPYTFKGRIFF